MMDRVSTPLVQGAWMEVEKTALWPVTMTRWPSLMTDPVITVVKKVAWS